MDFRVLIWFPSLIHTVNAFVNAVARSVAVGPAGMLIAEATAVAISVGVNVGVVPGWPVNALVEIKFIS